MEIIVIVKSAQYIARNVCFFFCFFSQVIVTGDDWNRELLYSLFPHNNASKIACCFVRGRFSCKSAYFLALEADEDMVPNAISEDSIEFWRAVWKARVPGKVKLFMWRACNNYVPTIDNLQSRRLKHTSSCTHCGETTENLVHVMFKCSAAKEVWDRCSLGCFYDTQGAVNFHDFCRVILENFPAKWEVFMMILWGLWTRRNKHFHGQLNGREGKVEEVAKVVLSDYQKENHRGIISSTNGVHNTHTTVWLRPNAQHIKINCDVAWQIESGKAGLGFVARDYNGEVLFSGTRLEWYASSPLEAEAKAVHWAMIHALNRGYSNVIFETDSLCLVKALHNKIVLPEIASLFSEILSRFNDCKWSFVKREELIGILDSEEILQVHLRIKESKYYGLTGQQTWAIKIVAETLLGQKITWFNNPKQYPMV
ncbi:hypothetical protein CTI12_AA297550 [Artemisia annua]|uniref:Uncharacterized protein n=1 Tax=Artemisia annua TaxID=35608 RepID=A0A2U1N809_ARTAN|nr:hypothetical protein CTI12_AA297550 [Artemisia annua]